MTTHATKPTEWTSSITPDECVRWLREGQDVVILTHSRPDGDAAGSTLALCQSLISAGIKARVWFAGPAPAWLPAVAGDRPVGFLTDDTDPAESLGSPDRIVITDTGSWSQLHEVHAWLSGRADDVLIIDHHLHGDAEVGTRRLIECTHAAACQVVAPICCGLVGCDTPASLPTSVGELLYLGLATDTGWFRHSNVSAAVMALASQLLESGVEPTHLYRLVEQQDGVPRWRLLGRALRSLEMHADGRVALMSLTLDDFRESGATRSDTGGFADTVQTIETVRVSAVLTEGDTSNGPLTKISLRSKPGDDAVDVNEIARSLGGGGHARAAGVRIKATLADAREQLLIALQGKNDS